MWVPHRMPRSAPSPLLASFNAGAAASHGSSCSILMATVVERTFRLQGDALATNCRPVPRCFPWFFRRLSPCPPPCLSPSPPRRRIDTTIPVASLVSNMLGGAPPPSVVHRDVCSEHRRSSAHSSSVPHGTPTVPTHFGPPPPPPPPPAAAAVAEAPGSSHRSPGRHRRAPAGVERPVAGAGGIFPARHAP